MPWHIISSFLALTYSEPNVHYHAVRLGERAGENDEEYRAEIIDSLMWRRSIEITGFLCVYILNGPLVSVVLGFLQKEKLGKLCGYRAALKVWGQHTHTHTDLLSLTHCNEQVMLRHRLLKSVIIINLSLHLSLSPHLHLASSPFLFFCLHQWADMRESFTKHRR